MSEPGHELSGALARAVDTAGPSVARVEGRARVPSSGIVWSEDGLIVTAHHALDRVDDVTIGLAAGESVTASLLGSDPTTDVAVLRAEAAGLPARRVGDLDQVRVGHLALALARPGSSVRASLGIIGVRGGAWRTPAGGAVDHYLEADCARAPGFSGGALVTTRGDLLGMNTSGVLPRTQLTIPATTLDRIVRAVLTEGGVRRGYLGIVVQPARLPSDLASELGQKRGLLLLSVQAGSPAAKAGLFMGDVLVGIDDEQVQEVDQLLGLLQGDLVGRDVSVRYLRGGKLHTTQAQVEQRSPGGERS